MSEELNHATTLKYYYGRKAWDYDLEREDSKKWKNEHLIMDRRMSKGSGLVLDIPCGTGRFFELYRNHGLDFIGMDVSDDMMVQARAKDPAAEVVFGDILNIPRENKSVDMSVCTRLLNFLSESEMHRAVSELCRVTTGRIHCGLFTSTEHPNRCNAHTEESFTDAAKAGGFVFTERVTVREPDYGIYILCGSLS